MRILHVSKYYSPYMGGVENICKYLVENMPQHQTAVVCFNEAKADSVDEVAGHKVWRVGTWINIARQALSPRYYYIIRNAIREFRPDVVQFHWANPFPAFVLLTVLPKDVNLVIHWHMDIIRQKLIYPFIKPIETQLLKRADLICVTSPNYRDGSAPLQPYKDKVRVVVNALDEEAMALRDGDAEAIKAIHDRYEGRPIVFFVGRHIPYKGLEHLVRAAEYIKNDCAIVIAGSGPLTQSLKEICSSDKVHFIGRITDDELRQHQYAADIFAFPSVTKNEAFGVALAEAMYAHTPAVTFTIEGSGVNWVSIDGQTGIEVPNGDDRAYAAAIDRLLSDEELRKSMGENAARRASECFTLRNMCSDMQKVYDELEKTEK